LFTIFLKINVVFRPKILELPIKLDCFFNQRIVGVYKLKLRVRDPLSPFGDGLFGKFEETDHDGLELFQVR
jgi:hypothetical protein